MRTDDWTFMFPRWSVDRVSETSCLANEALIAHTVLFDGPVLFSDSNIINNPILRLGLRRSEMLRDLLREGLIGCALRSSSGNIDDLTFTAGRLADNGGIAPGFDEHLDFYDFTDLDFVREHGVPIAFALEEAQEYYERTILRVFESGAIVGETGESLPDNARATILDIAREHIANGDPLRALMFARRETLGVEVERRLGESSFWSRWGKTLDHVANTPSMTFWADRMNAVPIYRKEHRSAISLWRQINTESISDEDEDKKMVPVSNGPARYLHGLAKLSAADIIQLRESYQGRSWISLLQRDPSSVSSQEIRATFIPYRHLVDDTIADRVLGRSGADNTHLDIRIRRVTSKKLTSAGRKTASGVVVAILDLATSGIASHLFDLLDVTMTLFGKDDPGVAEADVAKIQAETIASQGKQTEAVRMLKESMAGNAPQIDYESEFRDGLGRDTLLDLS